MIYRLLLTLFTLTLFSCNQERNKTLLFVGSYTDKKPAKGIKIYDFNETTGALSLTFELDSIINPSFLRISPNGKYIYSVVESQMEYNGKVAAFGIDSINGSIELINMQDCGGRNPVHIEIDRVGRNLVVSNYTDPSLSIFSLNDNGSLDEYTQSIDIEGSSIIKDRQESAHIHSSNFTPDGERLLAQDLGSDKIHQFEVLGTGRRGASLSEEEAIDVVPGSGPRHFTFHPAGKFAYGLAELSGKVTAYTYTDDRLEFIEDYNAYEKMQTIHRSADIHISPDGRFLYASNRGPEEYSIVIFSIDLVDGTLELIGHESTYGEHPRNFAIDPSGNFLLVANQFSNNVVVFRRDLESGKLTKLPHEINVDTPSSLQLRTYRMKTSLK